MHQIQGLSDEIIEKQLQHATKWLTSSGIINNCGILRNGVNAWYDIGKKKYSFIYSESTGYLISLFMYLTKVYPTNRENYVSISLKLLEWLKTTYKSGLFSSKYFYNLNTFEKKKYTFDAAICGTAIISLYKITDDDNLLLMIKEIANRLVDLSRNGTVLPLVPEKYISTKWSEKFNIHHNKLAIFLISAGKLLERQDLLTLANDISNKIVKSQNSEGYFLFYSDRYNYHAHCYACEGLLYAARVLLCEEYEKAAIKGLKLIANLQKKNGLISQTQPENGDFTIDVLSQAIQLWTAYNPVIFKVNINLGINALLKFQKISSDIRIHGGFPYSMKINHVNSWVTIFAIKALLTYLRKDGIETLI